MVKSDFTLEEPLPTLRDPHAIVVLRPWIDVGQVSSLAVSKIENHIGAQELGRLTRPGKFFDFTRNRPKLERSNNRLNMSIPNTVINYAIRDEPPDLLFFHILEPNAFAEDYIESILSLIKTLNVKRYVRIGGMYDAVPHTRPLIITGSTRGKNVDKYTQELELQQSKYEGPTSIVNLVADGLETLSIDSINIMVHLPQYIQLEEDHAGATRLLEILSQIYELPSELLDAAKGRRQYRELSKEVTKNPGLKILIERLETYYDSKISIDSEELTTLSPEVEKFLNEMGDRFQN